MTAELLTLDLAEQGLLDAANEANADVVKRGTECQALVASPDPDDRENLESLERMAAIQAEAMATQLPILRRNTLEHADRLEQRYGDWFAHEPRDHLRLNRGLGAWRDAARLGLDIFD